MPLLGLPAADPSACRAVVAEYIISKDWGKFVRPLSYKICHSAMGALFFQSLLFNVFTYELGYSISNSLIFMRNVLEI